MHRLRTNRTQVIKAGIILAVLAVVTSAPIACVANYIVSVSNYRNEVKARQTPFNSEAWKSVEWKGAASDENHTRYYMVDDLLAAHDFKGWHREDVVNLLGEPTLEQPNQTGDGLTYS